MFRSSYILFIICLWSFFGVYGVGAERKLHGDVISYLTKKHYIGDPNDLIKLGGLRLFSVGLTGSQLQSVFHTPGVSLGFDAREGTIVRGHWAFGPIKVLELTPSNEWQEAQKQEFELRVGGWVNWAERMRDAGWVTRNLGGWVYDWDHVHPDAKPFAMVVDDVFATLPAALVAKAKTAHVSILHWSTAQEDFGTQVKNLLIRHAHNAEMERVSQKAYDNCLVQARSECSAQKTDAERRGFERATKQCQAKEREQREALLATQQRHQQQQQQQQHQHNHQQVPDEIILAGDYEHLCDLIQDVISQDIMQDPVINVRSGQSYSRATITRWIRDGGSDPVTRDATDLDDLVPNRHLADLVNAIRPYCH